MSAIRAAISLIKSEIAVKINYMGKYASKDFTHCA
jgi:hypothetical protein